jgi:hypothetical protein
LSAKAAARKAEREASKALKEALCERAERGAITWSRQQGLEQFALLMKEWKQAGHASKGDDKRLWERFNAARDLFYGRIGLEQRNRRAAQEQAKTRKEELAAQVEAIEVSDPKQAQDRLAELLADWKQAGSAGRAEDEALWRRFKAGHDQVFARVRELRKERDAVRRTGMETKREIIAEARSLIGAVDLGWARGRMRELSDAFRSAPSPGREAHKKLLAEFSKVKDEFYEWVKSEPERRKGSGARGLYYLYSRKQADVRQLQADIDRVEGELREASPEGSSKRQHGSAIILNLGDESVYGVLSMELMRLRLRLAQANRQIVDLEAKIAAEKAKKAAEPQGPEAEPGAEPEAEPADEPGPEPEAEPQEPEAEPAAEPGPEPEAEPQEPEAEPAAEPENEISS